MSVGVKRAGKESCVKVAAKALRMMGDEGGLMLGIVPRLFNTGINNKLKVLTNFTMLCFIAEDD